MTVPSHWYEYAFPLPEVQAKTEPSRANYDPKNVAWMIEMLASMAGVSHTGIQLKYDNNNPDDPNRSIVVSHPNDKLYWGEAQLSKRDPSPEMHRYEQFAKASVRLREFEENSPAKIEYFNPLRHI